MASLLNMSGSRLVGSKSLPYDAEIEYLETTGTQWIDTGILPQGYIPTTIIKYKITSTPVSALYSARNKYGWNTEYIILNYPSFYWMPNSSILYNQLKLNVDYKVVIEPTKISLFEDGTAVVDNINIEHKSFERNIYIFSGNNYSVIGKLYSIQIKRDSTFLFDAIPVRVGNVGYMYDKVSGQLFGNAGTGSFILGPDK